MTASSSREAAPRATEGSWDANAERPQRPLGESVPVCADEVLGGQEPALTLDGAAEDDCSVRLWVGIAIEGHRVCWAAEFGQSFGEPLGDPSGGAVSARVSDKDSHHATSCLGASRGVIPQ